MDRWHYLKDALQARCYKRIGWIIAAVSLTQEGPQDYLQDPYPYRLVQSPTGYSYVAPDEPTRLVPLTAVAGQPLFQFLEETPELDASWCPNITAPVVTKFGNLLVNWICLVEAFGAKYPFVTGKFKIGAIETTLAKTLTDTPEIGATRQNDVFYVDEMLVFAKNLNFLEALSPLCVYAATPKNIVAPAGRDAFKAQLLKEYEGQLNDPTTLAAFEKALKEYDAAWLKDDPSNNSILMSSKVTDIARKSMYLTLGSNQGFEEGKMPTVVPNALDEGWPTDPVQYSAMINNARAASYSRAKETQKGGTMAKVMVRSVGNFTIVEEDCGTLRGLPRTFTKVDIQQLSGRAIWTGSGWQVILPTDDVMRYLGQRVTVRSPMYCRSLKDTICKACAGMRLADNPQGLSNAALEISSTILLMALKARHGSVLSTTRYDVQTQLT